MGKEEALPLRKPRTGPVGAVPTARWDAGNVSSPLLAGIIRTRQRFAVGADSGGTGWGSTAGGLAALCVVFGLFPLVGVQAQYINLAIVVFIYSIVAVGISFLYHDGGLLSVAHGGLWGIGAYAAAVLGTRYDWSLVPILVVAAGVTALAAMSLASISTRVVGSYFIIILFAVSEVIYGIMINWNSVTNGSEGIVLGSPASMFGIQLTSNLQWYYLAFATLVVVLIVLRVTQRSQLGRHLRAIRDSRPLAMSVGISVARVHMASFAITGAMAGVAGVYWAYLEKYVVPSQYSTTASIEFVVVVLLGGSAFLLGPVLGAVVVIFLPSLVNLPPLLAEATIGVVFICVILLFPEGVVGLVTRSVRWVAKRVTTGGWPRPGPSGGRGSGDTDCAPDEGLAAGDGLGGS